MLSLLWTGGAGTGAFYIVFVSVLLLISLLSIVIIILKREKLKTVFSPIIEDKSKFIFTYPLGLYMISTLFCAMMALVNSF